MRVLHINCNYIGTALHQIMAESLEKLGHENQIFVPTYDKKVSVIEPNKNVCVCECFKKGDRLFFDYKQRKIKQGLHKHIDVTKFDVVHAYTLFTDGNCARRLYKVYGIPYVVAVRNTDVNSFFRLKPHLRMRGIQIMRDARAVFFLSESYRMQVFEKYIPIRYQEEILAKTYIIPNGIDHFWLENMDVPKKKKIDKKIQLIYAGRIDRNKNIPTTQKAMELLRKRGYDVTLTVIGRVHDKQLMRSIQKNSYTECFPAAPKEKLLEYYRASDIFVMPSYTESFGLVYAEAISQGLPVLYSQGQGFDRQFEEGVVGYHVCARDANSVAEGILKILSSYHMIQKNLEQCVSVFQWDSIVQKYDQVYKNISKNQ